MSFVAAAAVVTAVFLSGCGGAADTGVAPRTGDLPGWTRYTPPDGAFELWVAPEWERVEEQADIVGFQSPTSRTYFSVHRRPARPNEADEWIAGAENIDNIDVETIVNDTVDVRGRSVPRIRIREVTTSFDRAGRSEVVEMRFFQRGAQTIRAGYRFDDGAHGAAPEEQRDAATMLDRLVVR